MFHFFGLQIIVVPYFGVPMLTFWFIGVILIYYLIFVIINSLKSIKLIIPAAFAILLFFIFLNRVFGLVKERFFLYYLLFILGIIVAHIYTSSLYDHIKDRLKSKKPIFLLLIPLCCTFLGFIVFIYFTQFCYYPLISEFGDSNLYFILDMNPNFLQLRTVVLLLNLIMVISIIFAISLFNFVFCSFRLIFSKNEIEFAV